MSVSAPDIAFATELFEDLGDITTRKMMGALCLYASGIIFAVLHSDGKIYLKGAGDFIKTLENLDCQRWIYLRKDGKETLMPYWSLPDAALDDPTLACELARDALRHLT